MAISGITIDQQRITYMDETKARQLAADLNADSDDGTYYFVRFNRRGFYIEVWDDPDGTFLGTL